jgi:hypothetical protein
MLGVTIFGLFLTPTFYVVLRGISQRFWRRRQHPPHEGRPHGGGHSPDSPPPRPAREERTPVLVE